MSAHHQRIIELSATFPITFASFWSPTLVIDDRSGLKFEDEGLSNILAEIKSMAKNYADKKYSKTMPAEGGNAPGSGSGLQASAPAALTSKRSSLDLLSSAQYNECLFVQITRSFRRRLFKLWEKIIESDRISISAVNTNALQNTSSIIGANGLSAVGLDMNDAVGADGRCAEDKLSSGVGGDGSGKNTGNSEGNISQYNGTPADNMMMELDEHAPYMKYIEGQAFRVPFPVASGGIFNAKGHLIIFGNASLSLDNIRSTKSSHISPPTFGKHKSYANTLVTKIIATSGAMVDEKHTAAGVSGQKQAQAFPSSPSASFFQESVSLDYHTESESVVSNSFPTGLPLDTTVSTNDGMWSASSANRASAAPSVLSVQTPPLVPSHVHERHSAPPTPKSGHDAGQLATATHLPYSNLSAGSQPPMIPEYDRQVSDLSNISESTPGNPSPRRTRRRGASTDSVDDNSSVLLEGEGVESPDDEEEDDYQFTFDVEPVVSLPSLKPTPRLDTPSVPPSVKSPAGSSNSDSSKQQPPPPVSSPATASSSLLKMPRPLHGNGLVQNTANVVIAGMMSPSPSIPQTSSDSTNQPMPLNLMNDSLLSSNSEEAVIGRSNTVSREGTTSTAHSDHFLSVGGGLGSMFPGRRGGKYISNEQTDKGDVVRPHSIGSSHSFFLQDLESPGKSGQPSGHRRNSSTQANNGTTVWPGGILQVHKVAHIQEMKLLRAYDLGPLSRRPEAQQAAVTSAQLSVLQSTIPPASSSGSRHSRGRSRSGNTPPLPGSSLPSGASATAAHIRSSPPLTKDEAHERAQACRNNAKASAEIASHDTGLAQFWNLMAVVMEMLTINDSGCLIDWTNCTLGVALLHRLYMFMRRLRDMQVMATAICVMGGVDILVDLLVPHYIKLKSSSAETTNKEDNFEPLRVKRELEYVLYCYSTVVARWGNSHLAVEIIKHVNFQRLSEGNNRIQLVTVNDCSFNVVVHCMHCDRNVGSSEEEVATSSSRGASQDSTHMDRSAKSNPVSFFSGQRDHATSKPTLVTIDAASTTAAALFCRHCKDWAQRCVVCESAVRGGLSVCARCGHGGHIEHLRTWFKKSTVCASGCGCACLVDEVPPEEEERGSDDDSELDNELVDEFTDDRENMYEIYDSFFGINHPEYIEEIYKKAPVPDYNYNNFFDNRVTTSSDIYFGYS